MTNPNQSAIINAILEKHDREWQNNFSQIAPDQEDKAVTSAIGFLNRTFNKFDEMFEEVMNASFWSRDPQYRFSRLREGFSIFRIIQNYERDYCGIAGARKLSMRQGASMGAEFFGFIKNIMGQFRFFENWEHVYIAEALCYKRGQLIDGFLKKYCGKEPLKMRFWEKYKKRMVCLAIYFPKAYGGDRRVFLKDMLSEEEGVRFSFIYMRKVIASQVKSFSGSPSYFLV
ncbi:MAG TPA: hypothetical protein VIU45_09150 [Chitinophagaceae bacterium]